MASSSNRCTPRCWFRSSACYCLLATVVIFFAQYFWFNDFDQRQLGVIVRGMYDKHSKERAFSMLALKYTNLEPLRKMFSGASKSKLRKQLRKFSPRKFTSEVRLSDLKELERKQNVMLLVIVSSAPSRMNRRQAIRESWWKTCDGVEVVCRFFTDGLQLTINQERILFQEQQTFNDIEFQPLESTRNFGLRYLYQIMWAAATYHFRYLLRVDDDYFVCLERLTDELHYRPNDRLMWGSFHCDYKDLVYIDEAWTLFSSDVIDEFLSQDPEKMLCHPHADQQITVWEDEVYERKDLIRHFDDQRLYPHPAREEEKFQTLTRVCNAFLGIHGTTPELMLKFWKNRGDVPQDVPGITDISDTCGFPNAFNITQMGPPFKFELRPCIENPRWTPLEGMWLGTRDGPAFKSNKIHDPLQSSLSVHWFTRADTKDQTIHNSY